MFRSSLASGNLPFCSYEQLSSQFTLDKYKKANQCTRSKTDGKFSGNIKVYFFKNYLFSRDNNFF